MYLLQIFFWSNVMSTWFVFIILFDTVSGQDSCNVMTFYQSFNFLWPIWVVTCAFFWVVKPFCNVYGRFLIKRKELISAYNCKKHTLRNLKPCFYF